MASMMPSTSMACTFDQALVVKFSPCRTRGGVLAHPHGFVESVKADNVLPAGTTSKPSPAASPEMTLPFPE